MNFPLDRRTHGRLEQRPGRDLMFISGSMGIAAALSFGAVSYFGGVMSAPATRPTVTIAAGGGGTYTNYALEFVSGAPADSGRVNIVRSSQDTSGVTANPLNFGADFTIEFWIFAGDENSLGASPSCNATGSGWTDSNIVMDADTNSGGADNDFGLSLGGGIVQFGLADGTNDYTVCGTTDLRDSTWHHLAIVRATDTVSIYIDGARDTLADTGVTGSVAYVQGAAGNPDDHLITLGVEHHDLVVRDFTGRMDELRFSDTARYSGTSFTAPTTGFIPDDNTMGLFHFDEGSGTVANNREGAVFTPADVWTNPNGVILPADGFGPTYVTSTASTDPRPTVHFFSDWSTATGVNIQNAFTDGGKWDFWSDQVASDSTLFVQNTASNSKNFPTTNYVRIRPRGSDRDWVELSEDDPITAPAVGDTVGWRFYLALMVPDSWTTDELTHGFYLGDSWGPEGMGWNIRTQLTELPGWTLEAVSDTSGALFAQGTASPYSYEMTKDTVYRIEQLYVRTGTSTYTMNARVYDVSDRLLYEGSTYIQWPFARASALNDTTFARDVSVDIAESLVVGLNGLTGLAQDIEYGEMAAVAMCDSWCGAYPIVGKEN